MKLAKVTRRRLYEAGIKPVWIAWPESAPAASRGRRYPVYDKEARIAFQIRVEAVKRGAQIKALVKIDADPHRPMFGLKGVRTDEGYESEPERVSKEFEDQAALTGRAKSVLLSAGHRLSEAHEAKATRAAEPAPSRATKAVLRHQQSLAKQVEAI